MPFFSVVIPTYNRAHLISDTIQSVIQQSFTDWELLLVDDGSEDNTKEVIEAISKTDRRIRYIYQENAERSAARNNGIKHAKGQYICFLDSDDQYLPNHFETFKHEIDKLNSPVALFFTDHICNTNGIIHKDEIPRLAGDQLLFLFQNAVIPARVCVHANILENEKFDEEITVIEDKLLWTRIANHFPIIQINKETVVYTLHEDNSINLKNNPSLKCWDGLKIFFKRYPEINRRIPKRIKRNIISDTLFGVAKCYIFSNRKSKAIYFILYSIIIKPFHFQTKHKIYQIGAVLGIFKQHQYIKE